MGKEKAAYLSTRRQVISQIKPVGSNLLVDFRPNLSLKRKQHTGQNE